MANDPSDEDLLAMVREERRQSIGFENDSELVAQRERALLYSKGVMNDVLTMEGRSKVVSMDVADAIETVLPDLMEIFMGGDDIATFTPNGPDDEAQAEQESDYIRHVILEENDGFTILYTLFKDAMQSKTGVAKWAWEEYEEPDETFEGMGLQDLIVAASDGTLTDLKINGQPFDLKGAQAAIQAGQATPQALLAQMPQDGVYDFTIKNEQPNGKACIYPVAPEDFTVAADTVKLREATYCGHRTRPRAQALLKRGVPRDVVESLPRYTTLTDTTIPLARDTAGEHLEQQTIEGMGDLYQVEVVEHYLRLEDERETTIWRVLTSDSEGVLIEREKVDEVPFAAITPYIVTHRFYGQSVADKLMEIQKIRTALMRMLMDSGFFALNQRTTVEMDKANEWTLSDLLRNEPGLPIRVRTAGAVQPLQAGALAFDVQSALEFMAVQGEQRSGIVRNAQGLNPDTLHDTAQGAMQLMAAAQKRVRLIARVFAETGIKDLYVGVHGLLRKHAEREAVTKLRGSWVQIDPTRWGERNQMTIQIGLGSAGRVQDIAVLTNMLTIMKDIVTEQQGLNGPIVTGQNVFNLLKKLTEKSGEKNPAAYWTDPSQAPPQPPQPDPAAADAQAKAQIEGAKLQQKGQSDQARLQFDQQSAAADQQLRAAELKIRQQEADNQIQLAREQAERDDRFRYAELEQKHSLAMAQLQSGFSQAVTVQGMKDEDNERQRHVDLLIQASEAADSAAREHETV